MEKLNWSDFTGGPNPLSEAYRAIRANLQNVAGRKNAKIIAFTTSNCGNTTDFAVAGVAVVFAQAGQKTLLIDCNLMNPTQNILFDLPNQGLTEGIIANDDLHSMIYHCMEQERLDILTAGSPVDNTENILLNERMHQFLSAVREEYDYVILGLPPVDQSSDAIAMGSKADGVVLVVTSMEDKINEVNEIKNKLVNAGALVLGCILNIGSRV